MALIVANFKNEGFFTASYLHSCTSTDILSLKMACRPCSADRACLYAEQSGHPATLSFLVAIPLPGSLPIAATAGTCIPLRRSNVLILPQRRETFSGSTQDVR
jgi:hypothetical protein